jgi:exodeoxyribonuclease V alpha subunit
MVMNGDIGIIEKKDDRKVIVSFDNREVTYSGLDLYDLDLAYAISIHKSQGSEYSSVIIPINSDHIHMLSRNLLYTGITRGKKLVVLIGEIKIFKYAIDSFWKDTRYTNLVSALKMDLN